MNLYVAEPSEIVRSTIRDEEHLNEVESSLSSLINFLFRRQRVFIFSQWITTFARAIYYGATTVAGVQTIGEEYLGLVQMQGTDPRFVASDFSRLFSVIIETFHPIAISKFFILLAEYGETLRKQNHLHPGFYKLSQELPYLSSSFVGFIKTFNIALFYIFSTPYYDVCKAVTNIEYRSIRPQVNLQSQKLYKIMGIASFIRLLIVAKRKLEHYSEDVGKAASEIQETEGEEKRQFKFECSLCFENVAPVATPCGHSFCWKCIERTKESCDTIGVLQCPSCRFQFENNRVVPLMNY